MPTSDTALLVIDVQESFRHRPYHRDEEVHGIVGHERDGSGAS